MLEVIEDKKIITKLINEFANLLYDETDEEFPATVGFFGGHGDYEISIIKRLNIWFCSYEADNRVWNAFGIGKPTENQSLSITTEINFPYFGIDRRIAGVFAKDENDNIYILHRGKIGGGKKGVGKTLFEDNYRGEFINIKDGDRINKFALIGELYATNFPDQVANFVYEVDRIKKLIATQPVIDNRNEINDFSPEYSGKKEYQVEKNIEASCNHGIIVNCLAKKFGYFPKNCV